MNKEAKKLLFKSLNGQLDPKESEQLARELEKYPELQQEQKKMQRMQQLLAGQNYSLGYFFTEKVMNRIDMEQQRTLPGITLAFQRIALPGLVAAIIIFLFAVMGGSLSLDSLMGLDNLSPEYLSDFMLYNY